MVLADLDGDGAPDAAVADSGSGEVSILLGRGDGTLRPAVAHAAGSFPQWVAVGDLDRNGIADLVVANRDSDDLSILMGGGGGSFQPAAQLPVGDAPASVALADVNGDGWLDCATALADFDVVAVALGNGTGSFGTPFYYPVGAQPRVVVMVDLDGDGKRDLAVDDEQDGDVSILRGTGNGSFGPRSTYLGAIFAQALAAADLDGDGVIDLVTGGPYGLGVTVLHGRGDGTFVEAPAFATGLWPRSVVAADFDGNGIPDLAVANWSSNDVTIFLGRGDGTFQPTPRHPVGSGLLSLAAADFDGDGNPDLAIADQNDSRVWILLGNGNGTMRNGVPAYPVGDPVGVACADLDGNGVVDLAVVTDDMVLGQVVSLLGNGNGTFQTPRRLSVGVDPTAIAVGEFDGDGVPDVAVTDTDNSLTDLYTLHGNGDGTFQPPVAWSAGNYVQTVAIGDLNGDGADDIVVGTWFDGAYVLLGQGNGSFASAVHYDMPTAWGLAIRDLDGDGDADVAVGGYGTYVLLGKGDGTFQPFETFDPHDSLSQSLVAADLDRDGSIDLAVIRREGNDVAILLGESLKCSTTAGFLAGEGAGPQNANRARLFDGTGSATGCDFLAYAAGAWGVRVATGEVNADGFDEILTGPGPGAVFGPQVRGFLHDGTAMGKVNYYAYGTLRYGVNVASGDVEGDGFAEILTGAGPGAVFGPHVRGWNFDGTQIQAISKLSYFAYGTLKYGADAGCGDVDADGFGEILTGPGPGAVFAPTVRGWNFDGTKVSSIGKINFNAWAARYGANVEGGDVDGDGFAEIAAAQGPSSTLAARFGGFDYDASSVRPLPGFDVVPFGTEYGGRLALYDVSVDGNADLLAGAGPDPSARAALRAFAYRNGALAPHPATPIIAFPSTFGVDVAGGRLLP